MLGIISLIWPLALGQACGPVDLETALALAGGSSDEVAVKRLEVTAAEADLSLARAARWIPSATATALLGPSPEARGSVEKGALVGSSRDPFTSLSVFGRVEASVLQPLYTWGRLDAAEEAAKAGVGARRHLVQDTASQVQLRIIQLYWGEILARRLLEIADEVEKKIPEVEKQLDTELKKGSADVKPADRFRVQVYKAQFRRRKAEAEKGLQLAHAGLAATLAVAPEKLSIAQAQLVAPQSVKVADLPGSQQVAARQRPDLAALDQALVARGAGVRAARGEMLPQLFLGGTFTYSYAPNRDIQTNPWANDFFNTLGFGIGLGLRQDLSLHLLSSKLDKARAEEATLRAQRDALARLVSVQVETAHAELKAATERYEAAVSSHQASKSWTRSVGLDLGAEVGDAKDAIEAYLAYVENRVELATATYELTLARARYDQAIGVAPHGGQPRCRIE